MQWSDPFLARPPSLRHTFPLVWLSSNCWSLSMVRKESRYHWPTAGRRILADFTITPLAISRCLACINMYLCSYSFVQKFDSSKQSKKQDALRLLFWSSNPVAIFQFLYPDLILASICKKNIKSNIEKKQNPCISKLKQISCFFKVKKYFNDSYAVNSRMTQRTR